MTTLNLYTIDKPNWKQVKQIHIERIKEKITRGGWSKVEGMRRGFLNCETIDNLVYGYFAQEGNLKIEQYDDNQIPKPGEEQESFERLLFLFFLEAGILVVQSIRISRYIDLTGTKLRLSLFDSLEIIFRQSGLIFEGGANFERYRKKYTKEELLEIFETNSITRVVVDGLLDKKVPEDLKLFNPDFDADEFLKAVIEADLDNSDKVDWLGENIQTTKIPKGLIYAGNPILLEGEDKSGQPRDWESETSEKIKIDLNTEMVYFPQEDLRRILALIKRKFGLFVERIEALMGNDDTDDLPLFNK
jgi:hypothetical protein